MRSEDEDFGEILMDRLQDCLTELETLEPDLQAAALQSVFETHTTSTFKVALALKSACLILAQDF